MRRAPTTTVAPSAAKRRADAAPIPALAPGGLRELRAQQLRTALIETAQRLFVDHGFDAVSVDDIAAHAQASRRTFFRYFGVKEDVLFAEDDALLAAFLGGMRGADDTVSALAAARASVRAVVATLEPRREELRVRQAILNTVPALQDRSFCKYARWEREAVGAFARGADDYDRILRVAVPGALLCLRIGYDLWLASGEDGVSLQQHVDAAHGDLARSV